MSVSEFPSNIYTIPASLLLYKFWPEAAFQILYNSTIFINHISFLLLMYISLLVYIFDLYMTHLYISVFSKLFSLMLRLAWWR